MTLSKSAEPFGDLASLHKLADKAARQIPPLWPLACSIAVNPFLGQTGERLADAAARLARISGVAVTMPREWYARRVHDREILDCDLAAALAACRHERKPRDVAALRTAAAQARTPVAPLATIADLAAEASGADWPQIIAERFGAWAAGYLDQGQALWAAPRGKGAWDAYRHHAIHDLTAEILGLRGFAAFVADTPQEALQAIARAVRTLGLERAAIESYFHQLLFRLGGWAQYARGQLWQAELAGTTDATMTDFLAIRLLWEEALFARYHEAIGDRWVAVLAAHARPIEPSEADIVDSILQEAAERASQRELAAALAAPAGEANPVRSGLQAVFCIDVRSEVFRRALETAEPSSRTLGFAGFFGMASKHRRFASDVEEMRLPVLLNATMSSVSGGAELQEQDRTARHIARARRAWGRFKLAAVSSFAFVEAMGPVYAAKLARDALGLVNTPQADDPKPRFEPEPDLATRITLAETVLRAMSLTEGFGRVVMLAGHGANVVNNPHASGLYCGACGGHPGDVSARLLASLLNDPVVRDGLGDRGLAIPADTLFVAALHDTTTDTVTLHDRDTPSPEHAPDLARLRRSLATAGAIARAERARHLPRAAAEEDIGRRALDWAETRPEWALAGCRAFIAAPRARTRGRSLGGSAFLHDYDWRKDSVHGFVVLELIMTAPVVVASWINLQYYGSSVAPDTFGSGNKLLHNVVGGIGVFEGNGGLLRAGLPWQSVHDGEKLVHEPLRLAVCIEAPCEAMSAILGRHENVRALVDNGWLHLLAIDEEGSLARRYRGNLEWEPFDEGAEPAAVPLKAAG